MLKGSCPSLALTLLLEWIRGVEASPGHCAEGLRVGGAGVLHAAGIDSLLDLHISSTIWLLHCIQLRQGQGDGLQSVSRGLLSYSWVEL